MKIYHGTSSANVDKILLNGITPRGDTESHWDRYPSRNDLVYLSTAYPFYFACVAAQVDEISAVFEVDTDLLDTEWMLPDEDFIAQCWDRRRSDFSDRSRIPCRQMFLTDISFANSVQFRAARVNSSDESSECPQRINSGLPPSIAYLVCSQTV